MFANFLAMIAALLAQFSAQQEVTIEGDRGEPTIAQAFELAGTGETGPNGETLREDDANDPVQADSRTYFPNMPLSGPVKQITGVLNPEAFTIQAYISGKPAIVARHVDPDTGVIDWGGVAGENDNVHDHWVDTFGTVEITGFDLSADTLDVFGHTVALNSLTVVDGTTTIVVQSQQGNGGGAHDEDILGTIILVDVELTEDDITFTSTNDGVAETFEDFAALIQSYADIAAAEEAAAEEARILAEAEAALAAAEEARLQAEAEAAAEAAANDARRDAERAAEEAAALEEETAARTPPRRGSNVRNRGNRGRSRGRSRNRNRR